MDYYKIFDFVSGIGCLVFALSFYFRKHSFLPERRLIFFFYVLGFGFIFRGIAHTYHSPTFDVAERLVFILFPLAATLYFEQMAKMKLHLWYKVFILLGGLLCYIGYWYFHDHLLIAHRILFTYEILASIYLSVFLLQKVLHTKEVVERSISFCLLGFSTSTMVLLCVDWQLKMVLQEERITSLIVFPFCYMAFLITFSGEGFSLRSVFKSFLADTFFIFVQAVLLYLIIPEVKVSQIITLFVLLVYIRMIFKIFSVILNATQNRKAHFVLEQINRLSRTKRADILSEIRKIENIQDARLISKEDFDNIDLTEVFQELRKSEEYFSRNKVWGARLRLEDDLDLDAIHRMEYTLDAFRVDFLFPVPNTQICFGLKFADLNQDHSIEERAYNIFTQITLILLKAGDQHG